MFNLVVALMVILVAAFWTYQGFFSAAVMFFECVVACMIAFAFYEPLNGMWRDTLGDGLGLPVAFMALFAVPLFAFRFITDRYVPDNVPMPLALDRAGGAICGLFSGQVLVGMALIGIQMLPIGSTVLGFERVQVSDKGVLLRDGRGEPVYKGLGYFKPDGFTVGLASMLSRDQRFGGGNELDRAKPDLLTDLWSARNVPFSEARVFLDKGTISITQWWEDPEIDRVEHVLDGATLTRKWEKTPASADNKFVVCTVLLDKKAYENKVQDARFRLSQFRIVGYPNGSPTDKPAVFMATGATDIYTHKKHGPMPMSEVQKKHLVEFSPFTDFIVGDVATSQIVSRSDSNKFEFQVAFEVPREFTPWYVEFKRGAIVDLTGKKMAEEKPDTRSLACGPGSMVAEVSATNQAPPGPGQNILTTAESRTGPSSMLPFEFDLGDSQVQRHASGHMLTEGHFHFQVPAQSSGSAVTEFKVPDGKRLFQVGKDVIAKQSMFGKAIGYAETVAGQTYVTDTNGKNYYAIGQYGAAEIGGQWWCEVHYYPGEHETADTTGLRGKKLEKVNKRVLEQQGPDNVIFGFLFVVDPGVTIKSFKTGRETHEFTPPMDVP